MGCVLDDDQSGFLWMIMTTTRQEEEDEEEHRKRERETEVQIIQQDCCQDLHHRTYENLGFLPRAQYLFRLSEPIHRDALHTR